MEIAVIGAGLYGCNIALELTKRGHRVTLFEKNADILSATSGNFGIRLHAGPHYPRSEETRKSCSRGLLEFQKRYPELVISHDSSVYGLGIRDANGNSSKVDRDTFIKVCEESNSSKIIDLSTSGYKNLIVAVDVDEPSLVIGHRLRQSFLKYLNDAKVEIFCDFKIDQIERGFLYGNNQKTRHFDKIINSTGFQQFIPNDEVFPFDIDFVYQPCMGLIYRDKTPGEKPFSFIVMDGMFPCLMPIIDVPNHHQYLLTHAKWTIMGNYKDVNEANRIKDKLNNNPFLLNIIKAKCEREIKLYISDFDDRFEFHDVKITVLAKVKTKSDFRSAFTFEKDNIIYIFPGKVNNIFDVEREVDALLTNKHIQEFKGHRYVKDGMLHRSLHEVTEKPNEFEPSTCNLKTFEELSQLESMFNHSILKASSYNIRSELNKNIKSVQDNTEVQVNPLLSLLSHLDNANSLVSHSVQCVGMCLSPYNLFSNGYRKTTRDQETQDEQDEKEDDELRDNLYLASGITVN